MNIKHGSDGRLQYRKYHAHSICYWVFKCHRTLIKKPLLELRNICYQVNNFVLREWRNKILVCVYYCGQLKISLSSFNIFFAWLFKWYKYTIFFSNKSSFHVELIIYYCSCHAHIWPIWSGREKWSCYHEFKFTTKCAINEQLKGGVVLLLLLQHFFHAMKHWSTLAYPIVISPLFNLLWTCLMVGCSPDKLRVGDSLDIINYFASHYLAITHYLFT